MAKISYVNGKYLDHKNAYIHIDDRGYYFADGVYEVITVLENNIIDWELHYKRLVRSLTELQISNIFKEDELYTVVKNTLEKNNLSNATIYLQITRGVAEREHQFPKNVSPAIIVTASNIKKPNTESYKNGVSIITCPDIRWLRRDIKSISLLPNILAKQQAVEAGAAEALFVDTSGTVTECTASNFFMIDDNNTIITHKADHYILNGITRCGIIECAKKLNIQYEEKNFSLTDILAAKEAFISSTTKWVLPVVKVDNKKIGEGKAGKVTRQIMEEYKTYINNQIKKK